MNKGFWGIRVWSEGSAAIHRELATIFELVGRKNVSANQRLKLLDRGKLRLFTDRAPRKCALPSSRERA